MNFVGLKGLRSHLSEVKKTSQNPDVVFNIELLQYFGDNKIPVEPYTQIILDIELFYIRLYMIDEIIKKSKKLPELGIENLKIFRLAFTHESSDAIFRKRNPFVYFINWFKPDLSEISYRFFDFDGKNARDEIMYQAQNVQLFQDWYNKVYDE